MKGITYFTRWGFSINEGQFPNIHVNWSNPFLYIAFTKGWRFWTDFRRVWKWR